MAIVKETITPEDFDNFTEERLEKQIELIAATHPKYVVTEKNFYARLLNGDVLTFPLHIRLRDLNEIDTEDNGNPVDQIQTILERFGSKKDVDKLLNASISEATYIAGKYFDIVSQIAQKSLEK